VNRIPEGIQSVAQALIGVLHGESAHACFLFGKSRAKKILQDIILTTHFMSQAARPPIATSVPKCVTKLRRAFPFETPVPYRTIQSSFMLSKPAGKTVCQGQRRANNPSEPIVDLRINQFIPAHSQCFWQLDREIEANCH
jgi:hypothetical protein